tara:strand:- start:11296 stop:11634 length:339 start_codon:yes stop_codon:yes gene_type:complete
MKLIDRITDNAFQNMTLTGNAGQSIKLSMRYMPSQQGWFMDVSYEGFRLYGVRVVASPNMLRAYRNKIPFGLLCTTKEGVDPYRINDFEAGYAKMYLMTADDVMEIEAAVYG